MYGNQSVIGLAFQSSYGTVASTSSLDFFEFVSESVDPDRPSLVSQGNRGVFDEGESYQGPETIGGDLMFEARPIELGIMLKAMFGDPVTVQSGDIYTHTFKPRTVDFTAGKCANNPLTYYKYSADAGSADLFYDLNATGLELAIANGEFLTSKLDLVGGSFSQVASVAAAYQIGKRFTWDTTSVSLAGAADDTFTGLTITIDEGLEAQHTLNNSREPSRIRRTGDRTVAVGGTFKFEDQAKKQSFLAQSESSWTINLKGVTEIQSGYYDELRITMPSVRLSENKNPIGGRGPLEPSLSGMAKYSTSSATAVEFTLVNTRAAY